MGKTVIERLEILLNEKDNKIARLESALERFEEKEEDESWNWTRHTIYTEEENKDLPIPRLELRCYQLNEDWYSVYWAYGIVYKHFMGQIIFVPLGGTTIEGRSGRLPIIQGKIELPFRDGVHIKKDKEHLNLRAFAIVDDLIEEL